MCAKYIYSNFARSQYTRARALQFYKYTHPETESFVGIYLRRQPTTESFLSADLSKRSSPGRIYKSASARKLVQKLSLKIKPAATLFGGSTIARGIGMMSDPVICI